MSRRLREAIPATQTERSFLMRRILTLSQNVLILLEMMQMKLL